MPAAMDYDNYIYLTVTLSSQSPFAHNPVSIKDTHPSLDYAGNVGQLPDVQILSVPRSQWDNVSTDVLWKLRSLSGVLRVDVQDQLRTRTKRSTEDL
ncbi:hypothetical protein K474DRAFT_1656608 [Panus rudis PR-1116 ss-1]|nr:hypothetical protein K474DRAFT_1656608 [Panus rudis PR-1116 ss-1]